MATKQPTKPKTNREAQDEIANGCAMVLVLAGLFTAIITLILSRKGLR